MAEAPRGGQGGHPGDAEGVGAWAVTVPAQVGRHRHRRRRPIRDSPWGRGGAG
jgi:hypothetical protein